MVWRPQGNADTRNYYQAWGSKENKSNTKGLLKKLKSWKLKKLLNSGIRNSSKKDISQTKNGILYLHTKAWKT